MVPIDLLKKYYPEGSEVYHIMESHARSVTQKALELAAKHPEYNMDLTFVEEAAMLHDIGCFLTNAPEIHCHGTNPYICHGYLGAEILRNEGLPRHALVAERHIGSGLSYNHIIKKGLPLPARDMCPVSLEEKLICFADKFYSKTKLDKEKSLNKVIESMHKHGSGSVKRFEDMCSLFL
ncbi:MAG: HD domain-containing protein [Bacteroidales bacterium]|nr:HD domain-containing protein [Bacteroidales bacterium]